MSSTFHKILYFSGLTVIFVTEMRTGDTSPEKDAGILQRGKVWGHFSVAKICLIVEKCPHAMC